MKLLQRVTTLIRANLNDLVDRAEDPEKMIKQLITDLNNQVIQVKTTVAQSLADQYMLERRLAQAKEEAEKCERRAQVAVEKGDDTLARAALQRLNSFNRTSEETQKHLDEQKKETEELKIALSQLDLKIAEVTRERDVLLARHRRAAAKTKMASATRAVRPDRLEELLNAIGGYVDRAEAHGAAAADLAGSNHHAHLARLEEEDQVDKQLAELKAKVAEGKSAAA